MAYWLVLGVLCCWRLTHLLHAEDGPWAIVAAIRQGLLRAGLGGVVGCFYCLSVWIAAPLAFLLSAAWKERLFLWGALSAGAILLERLTESRSAATVSLYSEDPGAGPAAQKESEEETDREGPRDG